MKGTFESVVSGPSVDRGADPRPALRARCGRLGEGLDLPDHPPGCWKRFTDDRVFGVGELSAVSLSTSTSLSPWVVALPVVEAGRPRSVDPSPALGASDSTVWASPR